MRKDESILFKETYFIVYEKESEFSNYQKELKFYYKSKVKDGVALWEAYILVYADIFTIKSYYSDKIPVSYELKSIKKDL